MDYTSLIKEVNIPELVKALRYCTDHEPMNGDCAGCPYDGEVCHTMLSDAAAAIEALEAEVKEAFNMGYNAGYVAGIGYCSFKRAEPQKPQEVQDV